MNSSPDAFRAFAALPRPATTAWTAPAARDQADMVLDLLHRPPFAPRTRPDQQQRQWRAGVRMNAAPVLLLHLPAASVITRWYEHAADAPNDTLPAQHPCRTRAWATGWEHVRTERIFSHRHLHVTDGPVGETVSFYLVPGRGSPYWTSQETDAGVEPIWPGPVLYAGSPHSEYGGAGTATPAIAAATAVVGRELAGQLSACAVVHPGLDTGRARLLTCAAREDGAGPVLDLATDAAHTRDLGHTLDHWWDGIPAKYRRETRRVWRRGTEAGLTLKPLAGTAMISHLPDFADLANGTADRHGTRLYGLDMLQHLSAVPGAVLLAALDNDGGLAGGMYGWLYRGCLYLWASGINYQHPAARCTYTWLMAEAARFAIDHGAHRLDAGRANYQARKRLGFTPQVLRTVIHLTRPHPAVSQALRELSRRLGGQAAPHLPAGQTW